MTRGSLKVCKEFINRENCKEIKKGGRGDNGEGNLTNNVRINNKVRHPCCVHK